MNTLALFKCGTYKSLRILFEVNEKMFGKFTGGSQLLVSGIYQLGWIAMRPDFEAGKLVKTEGQAWCESFPKGTHRMKSSWFDKRFDHLDKETGIPAPQKLCEGDMDIEASSGKIIYKLPTDCEQSYWSKPGEKRDFQVWKQMLAAGEITEDQLREWRDQPWFEMEVSTFQGLDGLDQLPKLFQTPKQMRIARGIDVHLTSQRKDEEAAR